MIAAFAVAAVVSATGLLAGGQRRMRPKAAAKALAALAAVAVISVVAALVLVSVGYLTTLPAFATFLRWCQQVEQRWVPWWLGQGALVALAAVGISAARTARRHRRARAIPGGEPVVVLAVDAALAYSLAGRPGQVVVSSGMLRRLGCDERRALFAHEQSHVRHHHHRYLWLADTAAAVPPLRPLRTKIRFAVERWADEDAVAEVGSRELVATALARAALAQADAPEEALAAANCGVPARVEALLAHGPPGAVPAGAAVAFGAVTVVAGLAVALAALC